MKRVGSLLKESQVSSVVQMIVEEHKLQTTEDVTR
jgi:hypothetical protein